MQLPSLVCECAVRLLSNVARRSSSFYGRSIFHDLISDFESCPRLSLDISGRERSLGRVFQFLLSPSSKGFFYNRWQGTSGSQLESERVQVMFPELSGSEHLSPCIVPIDLSVWLTILEPLRLRALANPNRLPTPTTLNPLNSCNPPRSFPNPPRI